MQPVLLGLGSFGSSVESLLLSSKLGAEFFNATSFNDTGLSAGVEGVAFRGGIQLVERVSHTVDFNRFFRLNSRTDDEGLVDGQVDESDFAVFRVNVFFHFKKIPSYDVGRPGGLASLPEFSGLTTGMPSHVPTGKGRIIPDSPTTCKCRLKKFGLDDLRNFSLS